MSEAQWVNTVIGDMIGQRVEVRTQYGTQDGVDRGILEAYDAPWIRLRKDNNEIFCFPIYLVRLVKLLKHDSGAGEHELPAGREHPVELPMRGASDQ